MSSFKGLAKKANDSLDLIFDTTAVGEYKSYNSSQLIQSQPCDNDDDKDEEEEEDSGRCEPCLSSWCVIITFPCLSLEFSS